ncbi:MAG: HAD-IIA family hydrolase [Magnetococcales bacterium]|nr:HAD-IIA family hydrolase [Magnetococcales bacterium]
MASKPPVPDALALQALYGRYRRLLVAARPELAVRLSEGSMQRVARFLDLAATYDCILFDAYGVLNRGPAPIPGAAATLAALTRMGKPFFLVSNNACHPPVSILEQLHAMGFVLDAHQLVTSGMVVKPVVAAGPWRDRPYCLVGTEAGARAYAPDPERLMVNFPPDRVDWAIERVRLAEYILVCSDVDYHGDVQQRLVEALFAERPRPVLLANPDLVAPNSQGSNLWVSGLTVADLEQRFGMPWVGLGKPFAPVFDFALERVGMLSRERILMVGDTLETDILGGAAMGFATCLTLSGVLAGQGGGGEVVDVCRERGICPDYIVDSIA